MKRTGALVVSLAVAGAAAAGAFALTNTLSHGNEARASVDGVVASRTAQLDRFQASLRRALTQTPPPLPPAYTAPAVASSSASLTRVVYQRAAPVPAVHTAGSEHENDKQSGDELGESDSQHALDDRSDADDEAGSSHHEGELDD